MKPAIRLFLVSCIALFSACGPSPKDGFRGTDISRVKWGGDFSLTAHNGRILDTGKLRGKVVVIFFGYTHCPDICAPTLAKLAAVMKRLGEDANNVQVLFVTVDPRHDTPRQLARFVPAFDRRFVGLTGLPEQIEAVARDHKVAYSAKPGGKREVDHFGGLILKNRRGRPHVLLRNEASIEDIEHDIRKLLGR